MHCRDGYVCGVGRGFPGEYAGSQNPGREEPDFGRDVEHREVPDYLHPFARCTRVSGTCFIDDKLRNVDLERVPALLPPLLRNLLVAGNDQIPAGPRGQIARNGCFQVQCLLHHGPMQPRIMPAEEVAGPGLLNDVAEQPGGEKTGGPCKGGVYLFEKTFIVVELCRVFVYYGCRVFAGRHGHASTENIARKDRATDRKKAAR